MALNIPNILALADHIEKIEARRFNMERWLDQRGPLKLTLSVTEARHDCNTAACIGGWADLLFTADPDATDIVDIPDNNADRILGLTEDEANDLFCPPGYCDYGSRGRYTQAEAAWTLRNLAETGEVKWRV